MSGPLRIEAGSGRGLERAALDAARRHLAGRQDLDPAAREAAARQVARAVLRAARARLPGGVPR